MNDTPSSPEANALVEFIPRLVRLADANMSPRLKQKIGAEEMAGSVVGSVWRMNQAGSLPSPVESTEDFWRLLAVIALNKIRKKARHYSTAKRDMRKELNFDESLDTFSAAIQEAGPTTEEDAHAFAADLERLQEGLTEQECAVLHGKLQGLSRFEIAKTLDNGSGVPVSAKTVTRVWQRIQEKARRVADLDP